MSEHTPGPWFWPYSNTLASHPKGDPDAAWLLVAVVEEATDEDRLLVAAAPDLLAACKEAFTERAMLKSGARRLLEIAIDKAEGR